MKHYVQPLGQVSMGIPLVVDAKGDLPKMDSHRVRHLIEDEFESRGIIFRYNITNLQQKLGKLAEI